MNGNDVMENDVTDMLQNDEPFVVEDGARDWPRDENGELLFSMDKLRHLVKNFPLE